MLKLNPPSQKKPLTNFISIPSPGPTTLHDRETKQVEFVHAEHIFAPTIYVYDGAEGFRFYGLNYNQGYGQSENKKVVVQREFVNAETNHLGIALPKGKLRFYRRDADGQLQFVGENEIDHTPRNETVRVTTGNAFDLVGERKQTSFRVDTGDKWIDESFEIKLRNWKKTRRWKSASSSICIAGAVGKSRNAPTTSPKKIHRRLNSASRSNRTRSAR